MWIAFISVATTLVVVVLGFCVYRAWHLLNLVEASIEALSVSSQKMADAVGDVQMNSETLEKLLAGLIEVTKAQVASLEKVDASVGKFHQAVLPGADGFTEFDERAAGREYERQELMRKGLPPDEAEARVQEHDRWSRMKITG